MPAKKKTATEKEIKPTTTKAAPAKASAPKAVASTVKSTPKAAPAAKPAASAKKTAPAKAKIAVPATPATPVAPRKTLSAEARYQMIQQAAYFIAESHGFQGDSCEHWAEAERQINKQLS